MNKSVTLLLIFMMPGLCQALESFKKFPMMTTTSKDLLFDAIRGDGMSRGFLNDQVARNIRQKFHLGPDALVEGVVNRVNVINEECSRLKLIINVPDVKISQYMGGPQEMFSMWYELNMCKDGNPPEQVADKPKIKDLPSGPVEKAMRNYYGE